MEKIAIKIVILEVNISKIGIADAANLLKKENTLILKDLTYVGNYA